MADLSDLELVAQATANERQPPAQQPSSAKAGPSSPPPSRPTANRAHGASHSRTENEPYGSGDVQGLNGVENDALKILGDYDLDDIDLSSLSGTDLAALQPLIDALKISDPAQLPPQPRQGRPGAGEGTGHPGDKEGGVEADDGASAEVSGNGEDVDIARILAQMDAAGLVADDLEGKLDKLLESLESAESELAEAEREAEKKKEAKS